VVAHRGIHHRYPENAIEAFREAWDGGIAWCECDVHASADGVPVVIHDATLERTTTGVGRVTDLTWGRLRELRLRDGAGHATECRLPSLEAALEAMPSGCAVLVEVKAPDDALVRRVAEMLSADRATIQSFDAGNVRLAARHWGGRCEFLIDRIKPQVKLDGPWSAVNLNHKHLTPEAVAAVRAAGKRVGAWTLTVEPDVRRVIALGVDTIISDDPHLVRRLLARPA
jgi:glycerophosphoryl diester phosphodiesterase